MKKTYSELIRLKTFEERFEYLRCAQFVGDTTFGGSRWLNQRLYSSAEWKSLRNDIIIRDRACDLGMDGYDVVGRILIHHINPITKEMIVNRAPEVFDPENLITVSFNTHQAIHYSDENCLIKLPKERTLNDTIPWR